MAAPTISAAEQKRQDEYRAKDDARTLSDAEEIHGDSKRLDGAHKYLKHSAEALHRTLGRIGNRKSGKGSNKGSNRKSSRS